MTAARIHAPPPKRPASLAAAPVLELHPSLLPRKRTSQATPTGCTTSWCILPCSLDLFQGQHYQLLLLVSTVIMFAKLFKTRTQKLFINPGLFNTHEISHSHF
jgi:hypothetical protein